MDAGIIDTGIILPLLGLIAIAAVALAWMSLRRDPKDTNGRLRGSTRSDGHHVLTSDYQSGLGGHSTSWRIPADPQAYAKTFVPKTKGHQKETSQ